MLKNKNLKLTVDEVKHVAELAKLELTPKELKKFQIQLSQVLDYVSQLSKVNTKEIEPTSQVTGLDNVFRDDHTRPSLTQKEILSGTKQVKNGFFKVKAIFE
jgi:aspartyl-tRNA(Asn)/glutamyl-tRNA(Gln) amidotransferase subunit C